MVPENPKCNGVNASLFNQLIATNVTVETEAYNVSAIAPTYNTTAFMPPAINNGALVRLENLNLQGFANGLNFEEHTHGTNIMIHSCINALNFKQANHASYFDRVMMQRNQQQITVSGSHVFKIEQMNCEFVGAGQSDASTNWQKTVFEFNAVASALAGGKSLTIYYVAENIRGKNVSCVMSFWNNDQINLESRLPPLVEKLMKLK